MEKIIEVWNETGHRFAIHRFYDQGTMRYRLYIDLGSGYSAWLLQKPPSFNPSDELHAQLEKRYLPDFIEFEGALDKDRQRLVNLWDRGSCQISGKKGRVESQKALQEGLKKGLLTILFEGKKIKGQFELQRRQISGGRWVLKKARDRFASRALYRPEDQSVVSGTLLEDWLTPEREVFVPYWEDSKRSIFVEESKLAAAGIGGIEIPSTIEDRRHAIEALIRERLLGIRPSQLEKICFSQRNIKKLDVLAFYYFISPFLLPHLKDLPLVVHRYPFGIEKNGVIQRTIRGEIPSWMRTMDLFDHSDSVQSEAHILADDERPLLYLVNSSGIEFASWSASIGSLEKPQFALIGLQAIQASKATLIDVAHFVRQAMADLGMTCFCKTTGVPSSLHLYVYLKGAYPYSSVLKFFRCFAIWIMEQKPEQVGLSQQKSHGKVWINLGALTKEKAVIAPYSLRANPLALVATPLTWEELNKKEYNPKKFDIETVFNRLQDKGDPLLSMYQEAANLKDAWRQLKKRVSHQLKKSA